MAGLLVARLLSALGVVAGVAVLVFLLIHVVPGDPVELMLGDGAPAVDREALRRSLGLDDPLGVQLGRYLERLVRLDLGTSIHSRRPVAALLAERIPATLELTLAALAVAIAIAVPLGGLAAARRGRGWDRGAMAFALAGASVPAFVLGPALVLVFSLGLGWLPVSGREGPASLILPAVTLGTALAAVLSRMVRATLLDALAEDYVRTARAKGADERVVLLRHALPNAALPVVTVLGLQLGGLLGGAIITEAVFAWPGLGQLTVEAVLRRDYPVVQGCVLLVSVAYVAVNTATDLVYAWLDPRVRLREGGP
ncbi:MAG: ABC transporter permease [Gammaproteobacteria bacterium]|nr:ABC transporter permease [Gammaproteobacteria bacterium]